MISCLAIAGVTALATYSRTNTASLRHSATHSSEKDSVINAFGGSTEEEEEEVVVPTISEEMEDTAVDESEQHRESFWPSYTPKGILSLDASVEDSADGSVDESEQHRESFWPSYTPKNVATSKKSA